MTLVLPRLLVHTSLGARCKEGVKGGLLPPELLDQGAGGELPALVSSVLSDQRVQVQVPHPAHLGGRSR